MMRKWCVVASVIGAVVAGPGVAGARGRKAAKLESVSAELVERIQPKRGFVDNPFVFDGAGGRLLYVNADAGSLATIVVVDVAQRAQLAAVDISAFTTTPVVAEFALDGEHFFVVSRAGEGQPAIGALIDKSGKVLRRFGPADDIVQTIYDGVPAVVTHTRDSGRRGRKRKYDGYLHTVEVRSLSTGKRIGKKAVLAADRADYVKKMDFTIRYWADDYTRVVGIKGGTWDPKEDQRSPDFEAHYELPISTLIKRANIANVIEHTQRMTLWADHDNQPQFVAVANDLSGTYLYREGEPAVKLQLAQPFHHYDHKSLVFHHAATGSLFFSLTIDPVNPDAVARKKADKRWLDLYELAPGSDKPVRRGRFLIPDKRRYSWRATSSHWALVPRHVGFERGGREILLYRLSN